MSQIETASERTKKNLDVIYALMDELRETLDTEYKADLDDGLVDWGYVGDLARIREGLNMILGHDDSDPE